MGLCDLVAMFAYNSRESRVTSAKDMADDNGVNVVEFVCPARIIGLVGVTGLCRAMLPVNSLLLSVGCGVRG
jgi:hypothetical protein